MSPIQFLYFTGNLDVLAKINKSAKFARIYLNNLAFNCRLLKRDNLITDTWSAHGKVKLKLLDGTINIISHEIDLYRLFPESENFTFNTDFLGYADSEDHHPEYDYKLSSDSSDDDNEAPKSQSPNRRRSKKFVASKVKI